MKIAYSGIRGAFAHIASMRLYPEEEVIACRSFRDAYDSVKDGSCDAAVLPIENSFAGEVGQVADLMFFGDLIIDEVYEMHVTQNLLGLPGAKISDIKKVLSHPQALEQCEVFLLEHDIEQEIAVNTARAAKAVAHSGDIHTGAIASAETAALYGLEVLKADINKNKENTTRFAIFKRPENENRDLKSKNAFILMFTVPHIAGGLARAINIVGEYGFNMISLRSRPMKSLAWRYYFYVEAEGDCDNIYGKEMLARLSFWCDKVKVVGKYSAGNKEEN